MGDIFNNRLLVENNRLLFSPLFSGNFCGGGQSLDGGGPSRDQGILPSLPTRENPEHISFVRISLVLSHFLDTQLPFRKGNTHTD